MKWFCKGRTCPLKDNCARHILYLSALGVDIECHEPDYDEMTQSCKRYKGN